MSAAKESIVRLSASAPDVVFAVNSDTGDTVALILPMDAAQVGKTVGALAKVGFDVLTDDPDQFR